MPRPGVRRRILPTPDGAPLLIMTGPTIGEQRNEYRLDVSRYFASASVTLGLGHSTEDDYQSNSVSVAAEFELQQAMTTLSVGASYSNDDLAPTDAAEFGRVPDASKTSRSFSLGVTRVLNRHAVLQASTSVTRWSGFLSDPYKLRDVRPDRRTAGTLGLRYRQFIPAAQAALHADYRFYADDYDVRAHSLELGWHQNLGSRWQLVPRLRYHSQSDAEFFTPADDFSRPITESQSSDARLSAFGALSGGVTLGYRRESWGAKFTVERYAADSDRGLSGGGPDLPGLVNFTLAVVRRRHAPVARRGEPLSPAPVSRHGVSVRAAAVPAAPATENAGRLVRTGLPIGRGRSAPLRTPLLALPQRQPGGPHQSLRGGAGGAGC